MIAVDTSALIAILNDEPDGLRCTLALLESPVIVMSAVILTEALVVAGAKGVRLQMEQLLGSFEATVIAATEPTAYRIIEIYSRWGKGVHPAALNFADCFAYDVARQHDCPLLYVGTDFAQTDIASALPR